MITLPLHPLPAKPTMLQPCNGCGLCCSVQLCPVAETIYVSAPCPALRFRDGRTFCGLVETEKKHGLEPIIANSLGIGVGCSMGDDVENL